MLQSHGMTKANKSPKGAKASRQAGVQWPTESCLHVATDHWRAVVYNNSPV
jgi:hypothetical protein